MRRNDPSAQALLYRRHAAEALALAIRFSSHPNDAEDIVHDAFLTAFGDLRQLSQPAAFRGWLLRIVVRQIFRRSRRRGLLARLGVGAELPGVVALPPAPSLNPEARAELFLLERVLSELPLKQRVPWVLHAVEGYTLPEAAEVCGCSLATVKRRIQEAEQRVAAHVRLDEVFR